jgi:hypothetical protein
MAMRKQIASSIAFLLIGFVFLNGLAQGIISFTSGPELVRWRQVANVIEKSRRKIPGTVVVLGDSVAAQLFSSLTTANSLTINGAVMNCGQYILAYNALTRNPQIKTLVLILHPESVGFGFERRTIYSSFVKPFYTPANVKHFSRLVWSKMRTRPLSYLTILPLIKVARCFPDIRFPGRDKAVGLFSDTSLEYLHRIEGLAEAHRVQLILLSPPLRTSFKKRIMNRFRPEVDRNGLKARFGPYFKRLVFVEDKHFQDRVHLRSDYLRRSRLELRKRILPASILAEFDRYARTGSEKKAKEKKIKAGHSPDDKL